MIRDTVSKLLLQGFKFPNPPPQFLPNGFIMQSSIFGIKSIRSNMFGKIVNISNKFEIKLNIPDTKSNKIIPTNIIIIKIIITAIILIAIPNFIH